MKHPLMKSILLQNCVVLGVGAALLFSVSSARADDPKPKRQTSTETRDDSSYTPAKAYRSGKKKPSVDGRNATSAKNDTVGGANGQETRVPTGSHLPKTYQRKGYTTDRDPSTTIIDQNDIRFRNSDTVSDTLRQVPGVNIGGRR